MKRTQNHNGGNVVVSVFSFFLPASAPEPMKHEVDQYQQRLVIVSFW